MRDFFEKVPIYVILVIVVAVVRGLMRLTKRARGESRSDAGESESDEQRRVREIQERIRRIAAERRGGRAPVPQPPPLHVPESARSTDVPPLDPFGGPRKPVPEELLRRLRPVPTPTPPPLVAHANRADLERQAQLREQLRDVEETKFLAQRHAAQTAEEKRVVAESEAGQRASARVRLLDDLRDPQSLRRAFVLREVLGPPVGLK